MKKPLTLALALALAACSKPGADTPDAGSALFDAGPASTAQAIQGLELYAVHGCAACHCNAGEGGCNLEAPNIQGVSYTSLEANLRFASTADEFPGLPVPFDPHPVKLRQLGDADLRAFEVFLGTLSGGTQVENESPIGRGYQLYVSGTCISCHLMSAQGANQGGIGQAIAGIDPDNIYYALAGGVPCHPMQNRVPTSSTGQPLPVCSVLDRYITDNPTVAALTDTPPPDADPERIQLAYFLAFISPPPIGGDVEPCEGRSGEICTIAGNGVGGFNADDIESTDALLYYPMNITLTDWDRDGAEDLVIVDWNNHRIRVVSLDREVDGVRNRIITIAGDGKVTGTDALNHPTDVAFDAEGNLVIATWHNQNVYRYVRGAPEGTERDHLAGLCDLNCGPDGAPTSVETTPLALPVSLAILPDGGILFAESFCARVRLLTVTGTPTHTQPEQCIDPVRLFTQSTLETVAGRARMFGRAGDDGPAREATFNPNPSPNFVNFGIALEKGPNPRRLYVADSGNNVIRWVDLGATPPTVHLLAGVPQQSGLRDGPAGEALFNFPTNVYAHTDGSVYVTDTRNHVIRRIDASGVVTTVAGTGRAGFNGDNLPATDTQLNAPHGVVVHPDGRIFISDTNNNRIRVLRP